MEHAITHEGKHGSEPTEARKPAELPEEGRRMGAMWSALSLSSVGIEMAVCVVIGWGLGYWLDGKFGTTPWLMLVFLLVGTAAGFRALIRAGNEAKSAAERSNR